MININLKYTSIICNPTQTYKSRWANIPYRLTIYTKHPISQKPFCSLAMGKKKRDRDGSPWIKPKWVSMLG